MPGTYAMQAYDAAMLIEQRPSRRQAAISTTRTPFAPRSKKADFSSLRGDFKFGNNHYPIQDFYLVKVAKRADGKYQTEIVEKVFEDYQDVYAANCSM